jgi:ABC-type bacteriocin/lantibiotic exporter with double-glycine peptidase domain
MMLSLPWMPNSRCRPSRRLSLAGTLKKDPVILIPDEAASMFDQDFVEEYSNFLAEKKTVIPIIRRRASFALADRVLEMRGGVISVRHG